MQVGADRSAVAYVWPPSLLRPSLSSTVIYLDLNHWIGLAKASTGHRDGQRYLGLLRAARSACRDGRAVFPLSGQHYMELAGIASPRQRMDVGRVMEELSGFSTLLCRSLVMRLELESVLDRVAGPRPRAYEPIPMISAGCGHAFGKIGKLRVGVRGDDTDPVVRDRWPGGPAAFDAWLAEAQLYAERQLLFGPSDDQLEALGRLGYDATSARRGQEVRAQQEREQAARFDADPRWRRGRIRDVVSARYMAIELFDMLMDALAARSVTLDDVWTGPAVAREIVDSMPSADVHVTLQTAAHRDSRSRWTSNDFFDIDALSLAVPYCDVVVTDRQRCHVLTTCGTAQRLETTVLATHEDLLPVILGLASDLP